MSIRTKCPACQTVLGVPDSAAGKSARCQSCQQVFKIPSPSAPQAQRPQKPGSQGGAKLAAIGGRVIKCPGCQSAIRIPTASQGKILACPRCQKKFRVPGTPTTAVPKPGGITAKPSAPAKPKLKAPAPSSPASRNASPGSLDDFDFGDLGDINAPTAGPYAPPSLGFGSASAYAPPRQYAARPQSADRSNVVYIIPAVFILIWSILSLVFCILRLVAIGMIAFSEPRPDDATEMVIILGLASLLPLAISGLMIIGSINMLRRTGLTSARIAAILALIPCFGGCVFPFGIWATVLLFTGSVNKDFPD